jgi:hypothetical protein
MTTAGYQQSIFEALQDRFDLFLGTADRSDNLYVTVEREIPLNHVLKRKVRRAAETGLPFIRVHDLLPH